MSFIDQILGMSQPASAQTPSASSATLRGDSAPPRSANLRDEILRRWGQYGEWDAAGVDRAQELADLLSQNGITSLDGFSRGAAAPWQQPQSPMRYGRDAAGSRAELARRDAAAKAEYDANPNYQWQFGDRTVGFLGDANNDGSYGRIGSNSQRDLIAWSARGKGNVGYVPKQAPDGSWYIAPSWSSSSDMDQVRDVLGIIGTLAGGYALGVAAGGGAAGGAAGGATGGAAPAVASGGSQALTSAELLTGTTPLTGGGSMAAGSSTAGALPSVGTAAGSTAGTAAGATSYAVPAWSGGGIGGVGGSAAPAAAGAGGSYWDAAQGFMNIAGGIYGMRQADKAAERMDPFGPYRARYAQLLQQLEENPNAVSNLPGFRAGLRALESSTAAGGYFGSGNAAAALTEFGGNFYQQELDRLARLAGAGGQPGAGALGAADLTGRSMASIGYGIGQFGKFMGG